MSQEQKLQTLRAESLRIAAELLRLSGTDVLSVEMLPRTHVVELAMKLKEAYIASGEQPGRLIGGGK